jgi:hypothetical protein
METDVQVMCEGFDHGYVNKISFYVYFCDVDDEKRLVEIKSMSPIWLLKSNVFDWKMDN